MQRTEIPRPRRRALRPIPIIAVIAVLGAAGFVAAHAFSPGAPPPAQAPVPVPVVTVPVQQGDVPILLSGLGTVQALNAAVIRAQVTGVLLSVDFTEGQAVKRGDRLAQIDPRSQQAHLDEMQAQLSRDHAQEANVQVNLSRNLPLLSRGFATDQQVTNQRSQVSQLEQSIKSDQALVEDAQTQLSYTTLTAPFDGVTGVRALDVGNVIHPADANGLVTVTQVQPISVVFTLPSKAIPDVQAALAHGPVLAIAYDQAGTRKLDTGTLLLINNQADPATGTVELKAIFPNAARTLWPGTFVNVDIQLRTVKGGLTVPTDAVQRGAKGDFAFVVGADGKVTAAQVRVDQRERGVALVGRGLKAGQAVVTQGQYRLAEGTLVTPAKPGEVRNESAATSGLLP